MDKLDTNTDVDVILRRLGWRGRYQIINFFFLALTNIPMTFPVLTVVLLGKYLDHQCAHSEHLNDSWNKENLYNITYGACSIDLVNGSDVIKSTDCINGYDYPSGRDESFVGTFDLVCGQAYLSDLSQTIMSVGQMAGGLIFAAISDYLGRKPVLIGSNLLLLITGIVMAFSPSFTFFLILKFFDGASREGLALIMVVVFLEFLPYEQRALGLKIHMVIWSLCATAMGPYVYLMRALSWRYIQVILTLSSIPVFVHWWVSDETIRWLIAKGKLERAKVLICKAAKTNKVDVDYVMSFLSSEENGPELEALRETQSNPQLALDFSNPNNEDVKTTKVNKLPEVEVKLNTSVFLTNKKLLLCLVIMTFAMLVNSIMFFGLLMMSESLTDDLYLGFFLNNLMDVPSAIVFWLVVDRISRKRFCQLFILISAVSMACSLIIQAEVSVGMARKVLLILMPLIGKFAIATSFLALYVYIPEVFPTPIRNQALAITVVGAKVGFMLAPFSRTLTRHVAWGPGVVFTALTILLLFMLHFMPDFDKEELPQTEEDFNRCFDKRYKKHGSNSYKKCASNGSKQCMENAM